MTDEAGGLERTAVATLAGGCFWCLEPVFRALIGVKDVVVGYAGGDVPNPSYQLVCTGTTGHAEVAQVEYYPDKISFRELLEVFFTVHNPTTLNRQGPDVGPQYRSAIFYHNDEQREIAEEVMRRIEEAGVWEDEIVTEIAPLDNFYPAEDYHQRYYQRNPNQAYCQAIINPKLKKFRQRWASKLKKEQAEA